MFRPLECLVLPPKGLEEGAGFERSSIHRVSVSALETAADDLRVMLAPSRRSYTVIA